jgi:hypothetical protein
MSGKRFPEVHKPQVLKSFTLSKASRGACSACRSNMGCFILFAYNILHIMCRVLLIDGDRLHCSTFPYIILVSCIIFTTRTDMRS